MILSAADESEASAVDPDAAAVARTIGRRGLRAPSLEHGARHILGFGGEAEVVEPATLCTLVAEMAARTLRGQPPSAGQTRAAVRA